MPLPFMSAGRARRPSDFANLEPRTPLKRYSVAPSEMNDPAPVLLTRRERCAAWNLAAARLATARPDHPLRPALPRRRVPLRRPRQVREPRPLGVDSARTHRPRRRTPHP
jgi:hypothetical protein